MGNNSRPQIPPGKIVCVRGTWDRCDDQAACETRGDCKLFPFLPKAPAPGDQAIVVQDPAPIDEVVALKALSDFCYPNRTAFVAPFAADYVGRGLAFRYGGRDDWSLTEAGWKRFYELDAERKARAAPIEPGAQLCVELDADELVRYRALKSLQAGELLDGSLARDLVGVGYLFATTTKLLITEEGFAWLRALEAEPVAEPHQVDLEEAIARNQVLDLPLFLSAAADDGIPPFLRRQPA